MSRPHVCFVLPSLSGGGAERAAVHIINALDGNSWQRSMYLFSREGPYLADVQPSVALMSGDALSRVGRWQELRRFIREGRPDLIVAFLSYFSVLAAARSARVPVRVVFNQQTPISGFLADADYHWHRPWRRRMFALVARLGFGLADAIVTTSQGVAEDLTGSLGVRRDRIRVVHNPVDLDRIGHAAAEPLEVEHERLWSRPVIVSAGRLADAKNYPLLVEALALLRERVPARLFILGDGERAPALRRQISSLGLESAVVLCGFQTNPWKFMARADLFALSSRYEGFGNVLVEAMACGLPVVATSSPGTREIVQDGMNGLLVDLHEPAALAAALRRVLTEEPMLKRLSHNARKSAERFGVQAIATAYERMFCTVLA